MDLNSKNRLGMGCWAIGGQFFDGETQLGFTGHDDASSIATVHAAYETGIRLFDTAPVYGAGHSERLLGEALKGKSDVTISTKIGLRFDENSRQVLGEDTDPANLIAALNGSRTRLQRDHLDIVFLHLNTLPVSKAELLFDVLDEEIAKGRLGAYGWSSDFPDAVSAVAKRPGFMLVQHAMNVFFDAPSMMDVVDRHELASFNRSPLAMGLLTGKFNDGETIRPGDVRLNNLHWMDYFKDGKVTPDFIARVEAVRDLLTVGGRSLAQGALGWLWAKSPATFPIPGARTPDQAIHNAQALEFGPLPDSVMGEIETALQRPPEGPARER
ncbi:MAG: aldo/keto reductase [Hyphomicrobiales bacterium]